jgi:hypothetical protein
MYTRYIPLLTTESSSSRRGKMSKYGSLRESQKGHCQVFLSRTAKHHDQTMEHPLMQSIYDKRVTDHAYAHYLQCLLEIFRTLETEAMVGEGQRAGVLPRALVDPMLHRCAAIEEDLAALGSSAGFSVDSSRTLQTYFAELFTPALLTDPEAMTCHHFLHYNAMLSGGVFLGGCLKKMGKPSALYKFNLGKGANDGKPVQGHQYVRDYMTRLDGLQVRVIAHRLRPTTTPTNRGRSPSQHPPQPTAFRLPAPARRPRAHGRHHDARV